MAASSSGTRFLSPSTLKRFLKMDRPPQAPSARVPHVRHDFHSFSTDFVAVFPQLTDNADFDQSAASVAQFLAVAAVCAGATGSMTHGIRVGESRSSLHPGAGVRHQYLSAPEIKNLRTVHASANERISRLRSRS